MADFPLNGRLLRFVLLALSLYGLAACATGAPAMILILNDLLLSAAAGVCIAYASVLPGALAAVRPTKGDYLGAGIFFVSLCMLLLRVVSAIGRDMGWPEIYNTHAITFAYALGFIGALMHLWAPKVEAGRLPQERWVQTGALVGAGLFLSLICWAVRAAATHPVIVHMR